MYYQLEPEVAGGFGRGTVLDSGFHPPIVEALDYEFAGWQGDEILESFPCYIVTQDLASSLVAEGFTGYSFEDCVISKSATFKELYPEIELPKFKWLKINGVAGKDDFYINHDFLLVVTERALKILKKHKIENCDIEEICV